MAEGDLNIKNRGIRVGAFLTAGIIVLALIVLGATWMLRDKPEESNTAKLPGFVASPDNAAQQDVDPRYKDLVREDNERQVREAREGTSGARSVVPPILGDDLEPESSPGLPTPKIEQAPQIPRLDTPTAMPALTRDPQLAAGRYRSQQQTTEQRTAITQAVGQILAENATPGGPETVVGNPAERAAFTAAHASRVGRNGDSATSERRPDAPVLPLLQVLPAVLTVGVNSDYPGRVVAEIWTDGLEGARLLGQQRIAQRSERAVLEFTVMVTSDGVSWPISALAVNPDDRIPALDGKVNRHLLRNSAVGLGIAFAEAFGTVSTLRNIDDGDEALVPVGGGGLVETTIDRDSIVQTQLATTLANTLSSRGGNSNTFRAPTLTIKAGTEIGVVFLTPIVLPSQHASGAGDEGESEDDATVLPPESLTPEELLQSQEDGYAY